jgi:hypothetical protein
MQPKTFYGWFNKVVRRYPYNEKTAKLLDHTFNPSPRLLTTIDRSALEKRTLRKKAFKTTMSGVSALLKQHDREFKEANEI